MSASLKGQPFLTINSVPEMFFQNLVILILLTPLKSNRGINIKHPISFTAWIDWGWNSQGQCDSFHKTKENHSVIE